MERFIYKKKKKKAEGKKKKKKKGTKEEETEWDKVKRESGKAEDVRSDPTTLWAGPEPEGGAALARCWAAFIWDWRWAGGWKYLHESRVHLFFT